MPRATQQSCRDAFAVKKIRDQNAGLSPKKNSQGRSLKDQEN